MKYLLDTCIVSFFLKNDPQIISKINSLYPKDICLSCITELEIEYGFFLLNQIHHSYSIWNRFKQSIYIAPFTNEDALIAAQIHSKLKNQGKPIGHYDLLIASTAKRLNLICVTDNFKEFSHIDNLLLENWRISSL